ncbi:uncharacterized protein LJ264_006703 [Porphyrio hochstetteri]
MRPFLRERGYGRAGRPVRGGAGGPSRTEPLTLTPAPPSPRQTRLAVPGGDPQCAEDGNERSRGGSSGTLRSSCLVVPRVAPGRLGAPSRRSRRSRGDRAARQGAPEQQGPRPVQAGCRPDGPAPQGSHAEFSDVKVFAQQLEDIDWIALTAFPGYALPWLHTRHLGAALSQGERLPHRLTSASQTPIIMSGKQIMKE